MFNEYRAEFEAEWESNVRRFVEQGLYSGRKLTAARAWLAEIDRNRQLVKERRDLWLKVIPIIISIIALIVSITVAIWK